MSGLGRPSILAALGWALIALTCSIIGARRNNRALAEVGARAAFATAGFTCLAAVALVWALASHDFSFGYVVNYSSRSLSGPYLLAAFWGGMEGSLLLWALLLSVFAAVAVAGLRREHPEGAGWAAGVLAGITTFFLLLLAGPADPFARVLDVPLDGRGLNPLLQSPGMLVHPPLLYTGFVGFSIPFAFAMAALFSKRLDGWWFTAARRWTLFSWSALSVGIVLGGAWAYTELGWGGYWAWDPVENASFMPWLTATAYLHSIVVQEKRQMFKVWNVSLILVTYALAVFGTFLTRSGILSSVHTFTEGPLGKWFLPFLAAMLIGGLAVIGYRYGSLRTAHRFDSLLSRESLFLANNVLFVAAAVTVLWGTIYPILAEITTGTRLSVGPPFFNRAFIPIALGLLFLSGLGPLVSWRKMTPRSLVRISAVPIATALLVTGALAATGVRSIGALVAFALSAFTIASVVAEFGRGSRVYRARHSGSVIGSLSRTLARNRRRYGGYIVHLGVALLVIGLAGAAFRSEKQDLLKVGDSLAVGDYSLTYEALLTDSTPEKDIYQAELTVARGDEVLTTLMPQRNFHSAQRQWQSEIAIRSTPIDDLYVVVTSFDPDGTAAVRAFVNPLTWWVWAGAVVMLAGMGVLLTGGRPAPQRVRAHAAVPAVATGGGA